MSLKSCMNVRCKSFVKTKIADHKFYIGVLKKLNIPKITPTMSKADILNIIIATKGRTKHFREYRDKKKATLRSLSYRRTCKRKFCNPGCIGTLSERGPGLSKIMLRGKSSAEIAKLKLRKKEVFDNRKNIKVEWFAPELDIKDIRRFQREGALSGCI